MKKLVFLFLLLVGFACAESNAPPPANEIKEIDLPPAQGVSLIVLGTVQDAGSPHIACKRSCCKTLFDAPDPLRKVVSLGVVDKPSKISLLFEATPDITTQTKVLGNYASLGKQLPDGIFLTHAHIGHYSGLMYLGKEATNAQKVPVYAMPGMRKFLENNGPWSQLVTNENIEIAPMVNHQSVQLSPSLKVIPLQVPHRDEYSETVGFKIIGPNKSALFIPDIDKWSKWEQDITQILSDVDYAFLDATFYDGDELNTRDISEIPHPFVVESMERFGALDSEEKKKVHFIHFNHTNALLRDDSPAYKKVLENGFQVARIHEVFQL
ncbi:MAG: MBL fold metallo-hydrolase [Bacteroidota bacterium]